MPTLFSNNQDVINIEEKQNFILSQQARLPLGRFRIQMDFGKFKSWKYHFLPDCLRLHIHFQVNTVGLIHDQNLFVVSCISNSKRLYLRCTARVRNLWITLSPTGVNLSLKTIHGFWECTFAQSDFWGERLRVHSSCSERTYCFFKKKLKETPCFLLITLESSFHIESIQASWVLDSANRWGSLSLFGVFEIVAASPSCLSWRIFA